MAQGQCDVPHDGELDVPKRCGGLIATAKRNPENGNSDGANEQHTDDTKVVEETFSSAT